MWCCERPFALSIHGGRFLNSILMKTLISSPHSSVLSGSELAVDDDDVDGGGFDDLGDVLRRRKKKRKKGKWERKERC